MIWNENQIDETYYPGPYSDSAVGTYFAIKNSARRAGKSLAGFGTSIHSIMAPLNYVHIDLKDINTGRTHFNFGGPVKQSDHEIVISRYRENPPHPMAPAPDALLYDRRGRKRY